MIRKMQTTMKYLYTQITTFQFKWLIQASVLKDMEPFFLLISICCF